MLQLTDDYLCNRLGSNQVRRMKIGYMKGRECKKKRMVLKGGIESERVQDFRCSGFLRIFLEKELIRKRREELKHAQDIREMYENKLKRTNKMYSKLTDCMNELLLKEKVSGLSSGRNSGDERRRISHEDVF